MLRPDLCAVVIAGVVAGLAATAPPGETLGDDLDGPAIRIERWMAARGHGGAAIGDPARSARRAQCAALAAVIRRHGGARRPPRPGSLGDLLLHLETRERPALSSSPFAAATSRAVSRLRRELERPGPRLGPADLLGRCIDAADGDLPLGILACHDFLKDVTLRARGASLRSPPQDVVRIRSRLAPWRQGCCTPDGEPDDLGPLYHLFATMTAGVWGGTPWMGRLAEWREAWRRTARRGEDRPDPEKAEADRCGANAAFLVRRLIS
jgi:hypothetical protein